VALAREALDGQAVRVDLLAGRPGWGLSLLESATIWTESSASVFSAFRALSFLALAAAVFAEIGWPVFATTTPR
jgi:hypothetical protein